jgi:rhamnose transport system permease protein
LLYVILAFVAPGFFSAENMRDLALSNVSVLLIAGGMTLVIVVGEIDISIGSVFAVVSVALGSLAKAGMPVWSLAPLSIAMGAGLGALNGALVSFLRAPSIVVTLATMVALREALRWTTGGAWVEGLPANFQWFGLGQGAGEVVIVGVAVVLYGALWWASQNLPAMRSIYAAGSDAEAARLAGLPVQRVVFLAFVLLGGLTGLAALLNAVRFSDVPANSGMNLELVVIAAVVVGGTPITGGRGTLLGTFFGVLLSGSIGPALIFAGVGPYWTKVIQGGIVLTTVFLEAISSRRARHLQAA